MAELSQLAVQSCTPSVTRSDEEWLIEEARAGDVDAFNRLWCYRMLSTAWHIAC
jgi:hypothetical protein